MIKSALSLIVLLTLIGGCSTLQERRLSREAKPVITESFASPVVYFGETWKIYLKALDPDGEMTNIYADIQQPGMMPYSVSIIKVKKENRKELSGYIYLSTVSQSPLSLTTLTLWVEIQDRSGKFSDPVGFPLSIENRAAQKAPPPGVFREEALGPVMVTLRSGRSEMD